MNEKAEEMRVKMKALKFPDDTLSVTTSSGTSSPAGSWSVRPARPRPSLNVGGLTPGRRPTPGSLSFSTTPSPAGEKLRFASGHLSEASVVEQERKLKEIMNQTGLLQVNGKKVQTVIDDFELLGDLGNGTCGHVVKMRHRQTGQIIAVKQMRRTGNSDENKRIIMDLDVVLKSHDCSEIVLCLGCFITDSDVWICMELMATCFDKLLKQLKSPIPEAICGKVAVSTLKALNYLKERHGVIHRDVKPSNILLDWDGRVKLCDFGISGRLVDSKAKTRSAGCAAYMAPERIDPPNPSKPDYDIRADVWSLGITLVELATGYFPYRDCKTDFEVLTKVLQDDPPLLPRNSGFTIDFCSFVRDCLTKNYKDRPKYKKLLTHPFILRYEKQDVDVGAWFRSHQKNFEEQQNNENSISPNNNSSHTLSATAGTAPTESAPSADRGFKPQPSPRVVRSWRAPAIQPSYPSAISDRRLQHQQHYPNASMAAELASLAERRPNTDPLSERHRMAPTTASDLTTTDSLRSNSKPQPNESSSPRSAGPNTTSGTHFAFSNLTEQPERGRERHHHGVGSGGGGGTTSSSYYDRWYPSNGGLAYPHISTSAYSSPYLSARQPSATSASSSATYVPSVNPSGPSSLQEESSSRPSPVLPRYGYRESPRTTKKFDFTFPTTLSSSSNTGGQPLTSSTVAATSGAASEVTSSPYHQQYHSLDSTHTQYSPAMPNEREREPRDSHREHHRDARGDRELYVYESSRDHYKHMSSAAATGDREPRLSDRAAASSRHLMSSTGNASRLPLTSSTMMADPYLHHSGSHSHHQYHHHQHLVPPSSSTASTVMASSSSMSRSGGMASDPMISPTSTSHMSTSVGAGLPGNAPGASQRSPSHERQSRSYFPSWRSFSTWNWQPPISLRRLRTTSTDRSTTFDSSRRFQPSYRSWNEKDNYIHSMKR